MIVAAATGTVFAFGSIAGVPWWHAIGGIATAIYVASTIILFPRLGAVVTVGLFIAGQMLASLSLDMFGVLGDITSRYRAVFERTSYVTRWRT
jgi:bacterial/archaeal transporter family-2 protein